MKTKIPNQLFKRLRQSVLFWTFAIWSYVFIRFYGLEKIEVFRNTLQNPYDNSFSVLVLIALVIGLGFGILYGLFDYFFEIYISKRISLGLSLLLNAIFHLSITVFVITTILNYFSDRFHLNIDIYPGWWLSDKRFWSTMFYIVICALIYSIIKIALERFGSGQFIKMLFGKYKNPKEEDRIFMFIDLKDSTSIAERLKHRKYSSFIQEAFYDLNEVVLAYDAEIYQYVGDEVVLNWPYKKGIKNNNCLEVFFAFEEQLLSRKEHYLNKYGVFPKFKAGLHGGTLIATEVGFVKKELAYHGDVINTSARIQTECNTYGVSLLISKTLLKDLQQKINSTSKYLGSVLLKGKQKEVQIYTIIYDD